MEGWKEVRILKLYFIYGTMDSAKSLNLLAKNHQFKENGSKTLLIKSSFDNRWGEGIIKSRVGIEEKCILINRETNILKDVDLYDIDCVFVDEVQFLEKEQIIQLWNISRLGIRVFCYGLKVNYKNELFESIKTLEVYADTIEELKSKCKHCNNKASTHLRYVDGIVVTEGNEDIIGDVEGVEYYESVCMECRNKIIKNS